MSHYVNTANNESKTSTVWDLFDSPDEVYEAVIQPFEGYILNRVEWLLSTRLVPRHFMEARQDIFQEVVIKLYTFATERHVFSGDRYIIGMSVLRGIINEVFRDFAGTVDRSGRARSPQNLFEFESSKRGTYSGQSVSVVASSVSPSRIEALAALLTDILGVQVSAVEVELACYWNETRRTEKDPRGQAADVLRSLKALGAPEVRKLLDLIKNEYDHHQTETV